MARERSSKGRSRSGESGSKRSASQKSGWVKPDGTPLRKRKGEYFPDQEINKRKPSARRRNTDDQEGPKKYPASSRDTRSESPRSGDDRPKRDSRSDSRPYERRTTRSDSPRPAEDRPKRDSRSDSKPYERRSTRSENPRSGDDRPKRDSRSDSKPYERRSTRSDSPRPADDRPKRDSRSDSKPFERRSTRSDSPRSADDRRKRDSRDDSKPNERRSSRSENPRSEDDRPKRDSGDDTKPYERKSSRSEFKRSGDNRPKRDSRSDAKPYERRTTRSENPRAEDDRPKRDFGDDTMPYERKSSRSESPRSGDDRPKREYGEKREFKRSGTSFGKRDSRGKNTFQRSDRKKSSGSSGNTAQAGGVRLNKFIANAGICSRREADDLITAGVISVNGKIVTELGTKVMPADEVKFHEQTLRTEKMVYVLLNKPKDYITTTDDPEERKTVMNLISEAGRERLFPVGRLDRNTTGLLLMTNDGELTKKLTHPSSNITKVYQVELDRNITREDMIRVTEGVELEDGVVAADEIQYASNEAKNIVGVELHSGRNRVIRRIFESMHYKVMKLDRVIFAGLTKKDLPRGRWRFLTEMEVNMLKMLTGKKKVSES